MRRHFRNHARRPPPPEVPSNAYPVPSQQPQQGVSHSAQATLTPTTDGGFGDISHSQLYPRDSDVRTNGSHPRSNPMTPPLTNEGSDYGVEREGSMQASGSNLHFNNYHVPNGHGPVPIPPGHSFGGPYVGFVPGSSNSMFMQQNGIPLQIGLNPLEMPFPVDPALVSHNEVSSANTRTDVEGDADGDGEIDSTVDRDQRGPENGLPQAFGHYTNDSRWNRPAPSYSNTRSPVEYTPVVRRGRPPGSKNKPKKPPAPPVPPLGMQFRSIVVPVGSPEQIAQYTAQYQQQFAQCSPLQQYQMHQAQIAAAAATPGMNGFSTGSPAINEAEGVHGFPSGPVNGSPNGLVYSAPGYMQFPQMYQYATPPASASSVPHGVVDGNGNDRGVFDSPQDLGRNFAHGDGSGFNEQGLREDGKGNQISIPAPAPSQSMHDLSQSLRGNKPGNFAFTDEGDEKQGLTESAPHGNGNEKERSVLKNAPTRGKGGKRGRPRGRPPKSSSVAVAEDNEEGDATDGDGKDDDSADEEVDDETVSTPDSDGDSDYRAPSSAKRQKTARNRGRPKRRVRTRSRK